MHCIDTDWLKQGAQDRIGEKLPCAYSVVGLQLLDSARASESSCVQVLTPSHMSCRAWGAEEVGDDFFEWLDLASSAGTAVFLDVVLEAHRLGDDQLQRFIDYFGQGPAAELLGLVTEVRPASSACSCWVLSAVSLCNE